MLIYKFVGVVVVVGGGDVSRSFVAVDLVCIGHTCNALAYIGSFISLPGMSVIYTE